MESKTEGTTWKSIKTVSETCVKGDPAFCLGSTIEKTNSVCVNPIDVIRRLWWTAQKNIMFLLTRLWTFWSKPPAIRLAASEHLNKFIQREGSGWPVCGAEVWVWHIFRLCRPLCRSVAPLRRWRCRRSTPAWWWWRPWCSGEPQSGKSPQTRELCRPPANC